MKVNVLVEVKDNCIKCPHVVADRTEGAGYAMDYHCSKNDGKEIMSYVEYESEVLPIPNWCPFL